MKKIIITIFIAFVGTTCSASVANYNSLQPTRQIIPPRVVEKNTTQTVYISNPSESTLVEVENEQPKQINYNQDEMDYLNGQVRTSKARISSLEQALVTQNTSVIDLKRQLQEANNKIASFKQITCPKVETPRKVEETNKPIVIEQPITIVEDIPTPLPKKESVFDHIINWVNNIKYGKQN